MNVDGDVAQLVRARRNVQPVEINGVHMTNSVYDELIIDLVTNCSLNTFTARKVVTYLRGEGILDYDILKEYYLQDEQSD